MQMDRVYMIPLGFNFIKWLGDHLLKPIIDAIVKMCIRDRYGEWLRQWPL